MYRFSTVPVFYVHVALFVKKFRTREKIWFLLMFQTVCCFLGLFFFLDIVIGLICVCILTCQRDSDSGKQLEENPTEDWLQLFVNLCIYSFLEIDTRLLIWQLWSLVRLCFYVEKIVVSISIAKKKYLVSPASAYSWTNVTQRKMSQMYSKMLYCILKQTVYIK